MFANLRADAARLRSGRPRPFPWYFLEGLILDNGFQAVLCYRLARWFKVRRIPFLGPFFSRLGIFLTGADLSAGADIGPGLAIAHGVGLVVGGYARIGAGATLLHGVTIGAASERRVREMPVLGDGVFVGAGAKVIGPVRIGDGAFIGAGTLVTEDVPPGAKVVVKGGVEVLVKEADPPAGA
jgi:serine O-acetyltransferase